MAVLSESSTPISAPRASRLYRLITMLAKKPLSREVISKKLRITMRGFYRDLELLRSVGVEISADDTVYHLQSPLEESLSKLPLPDPQLTVKEARMLAKGTTVAHRRLQKWLEATIGAE